MLGSVRQELGLPRDHEEPMTRLNRTGFLATGAALLASRAPARAQQAQAPSQPLVHLKMASPPNGDYVMAVWAQQGGIFHKYGLDVETTLLASGAAAAAALAGGALQFARSSTLSLIEAHARGIRFIIVAPSSIYNTDAPTSGMVVAKESPIRTGRDLNGKVVSVPAIGDMDTIATSGWIDLNGGDSQTVKFLELPHHAAPAAIEAGRIAAANLPQPNLGDALKSGHCRLIGSTLDGIGKHFISTAYCCTAQFASANPDVVTRFRQALFDSAAYGNAHHDQMWPVIAQFTGVDVKTVSAVAWEELPTSDRALDPAMIQPLIDAAVKYKAIPAGFPAIQMLNPNA